MIIGILLGIAIALLIVSGYIIVYGIVKGILTAAYTGAVIGTEGYISYSIIVFVFSLIAIVLLWILLHDKRRMKYFG